MPQDVDIPPRFVLLRHELPQGGNRESHFDLMLQQEGELLTWAIPEIPQLGQRVAADALPNHRIEYLDYEGAVSGDRGFVRRVDSGTYEVTSMQPACMLITLIGQRDQKKLRIEKQQVDQCWSISRLETFTNR